MSDATFRSGLKRGLPVMLSVIPFGALFGAVAIDNGLNIFEATLMSGILYAGASQLVGIELFSQNLPAWLVILSIFAVNFRHVLYSAAMVRIVPEWSTAKKAIGFFFMVDPQFAEAVRQKELTGSVRFSWYMGYACIVYVGWMISTVLGASLGNLIGDPKAAGFDVLLPIYFMGMVLSFRKRGHFYPVMLASATGAIAAYHLVGSPWHVSIGAMTGILVAVLLAPAAPASNEEAA
ncbi:AzlC family ABC transporter permease [Agrobacterium sp. rho-13.3]|jgi:predicted branched-subunit amino acid permease|uniref:AzlC family ABC transporter permease n=1 Tax=Agrobacterium sp. rho-13.3 TaxID=3072980 RepID=UPI002A116F55|nr:AzlC family ABC transporter permease [Agrobacterium sp. rho-13.3]MDX8309975.1 AzlC family ABC transporter permease [Agrobacterium sp. rho-13.3]